MSYGAQIKFGIARQTDVGSYVTAATSFHPIPLTSEDVGLTKEEVISANLTGRFEEGGVFDGVSRVDGTIEFEVTPEALGTVLMAGVKNVTGVASASLYTHTFIPRTADYNSLYCNEPITIYKQFADSNSAELYFDAQIGQVELTVAQGQLMTGRATVVGGNRLATGVGSANIVSTAGEADNLFLWDVTSISYNGSALSQATEMTVTINENIEPLYSLNNALTPYKYARSGFREVTVAGTMYFSDRAILNDFANGTKRRLVINLRNTREEVQSGYYSTFQIDIPQLKITQFKPGASGPGEVSVSFTGRGLVDPTSNYSAQFILTSTYKAAVF